jgi:hypothetical protein
VLTGVRGRSGVVGTHGFSSSGFALYRDMA